MVGSPVPEQFEREARIARAWNDARLAHLLRSDLSRADGKRRKEDAVSEEQLPLPNFDQLPLGTLGHRIRSLTEDDLRRLLDHEREHAARVPVTELLTGRLEPDQRLHHTMKSTRRLTGSSAPD